MTFKFTKTYIATVIASIVLSTNVLAVKPTIKVSEITSLQPSEENSLATKRATTRLTQSHYRKFQLDDAFSQKIFDR